MNLNADFGNKPRVLVADAERAEIDKKVIAWLSTYPDLPVYMVTVQSLLGTNEPGIGISSITSAYISKSYITGGYQAEYLFSLIYRIKPGKSLADTLQANEILNRMGDWARGNKPDLGEGISVIKVEPISIAETIFQYQDGDEDHQIPIKITYEVI